MHEVRLYLANIYSDQNFYSKTIEQINILMKRKINLSEKEYFRISSLYIKFSKETLAFNLLKLGIEKKPESLFLHSLLIRLIVSKPALLRKHESFLEELKSSVKHGTQQLIALVGASDGLG